MSERIPRLRTGKENPKAAFLVALEKELSVLQDSGKLTPEQVQEKGAAAWKIEKGFKDPERDAKIFASIGIVNEEELMALLQKRA